MLFPLPVDPIIPTIFPDGIVIEKSFKIHSSFSLNRKLTFSIFISELKLIFLIFFGSCISSDRKSFISYKKNLLPDIPDIPAYICCSRGIIFIEDIANNAKIEVVSAPEYPLIFKINAINAKVVKPKASSAKRGAPPIIAILACARLMGISELLYLFIKTS